MESDYNAMAPSNRTIGIRELKARVSAVLREVQATGEEYVITLRGRPIARLEPVTGETSPGPTDGMGGSRGTLSELAGLSGRDFEAAKKIWEPAPS